MTFQFIICDSLEMANKVDINKNAFHSALVFLYHVHNEVSHLNYKLKTPLALIQL